MAELEMLKLACEGHVRLIAALAAKRDELKRQRDEARNERDDLISDNYWKTPNY
jgi:hypothetical protein